MIRTLFMRLALWNYYACSSCMDCVKEFPFGGPERSAMVWLTATSVYYPSLLDFCKKTMNWPQHNGNVAHFYWLLHNCFAAFFCESHESQMKITTASLCVIAYSSFNIKRITMHRQSKTQFTILLWQNFMHFSPLKFSPGPWNRGRDLFNGPG